MSMPETDLRRRVPSVDQVLQAPDVQALVEAHGRGPLLRELRLLLDETRALAAAGDEAALAARLARLANDLAERLEAAASPSLVTVINATGVVVHTNLGRAPLSDSAAARVAAVARSYSNLEFDLAAGGRGRREVHAEGRLRSLLGAEAAVVVNNNAAAVLLAVNTLAEGREVLVSRGELVEIGGSFRIPDVLRKGGARLREVGTTNRTRLADFRAALAPETAFILKVHPSNFRVVGFTEAPALAELATLAHEAGLPLVEDLGSGNLGGLPGELASEPSVEDSLRAGVDLVTFSGDKLLGGPQAGLVLGRRDLAERLRSNPLYRALRVDKLTLAALDAVLLEHESGRAFERVPALRLIALPAEAVRARAAALGEALRAAVPALKAEVVPGASAVGGGAAPTIDVPTFLLRLASPSAAPEQVAAALRAGKPPVVVRVADERVVIDLRTVGAEEEPVLRDALVRVLGASR